MKNLVLFRSRNASLSYWNLSWADVLAFTALIIMLLAPFFGCEDASTRERADAHKNLTEASAELKKARHTMERGTADADVQIEQKLIAIRNRVKPLTTLGAKGQKSAALQLESQTLRDLFQLASSEISRLEVLQRDDRFVAQQHLEKTILLKSVADSSRLLYDAISAEAIATARDEASRYQSQFEASKSSLNEPIARRQETIGLTREKISQLESTFNQHAQSAAMKRGLESLELFERAMHARRQTHQLDQTVTENELELRYNLKAEHNFFDSQAQALAELVSDLGKAHIDLEQFAATADANAEKALADYNKSAAQLRTTIDSINSRETQSLAPAYEKADRYLSDAINTENRAMGMRSGRDRTLLMQVVLGCEERKAQLAASRARSLESQAIMVDSIKEAIRVGLLGSNVASTSGIQYDQQATEARKQASEALTRAKMLATQLPDAEAIVRNIDDMMVLIGGPSTQSLTAPTTGSSPNTATTPNMGGGGLQLQLTTGGSDPSYPTPEALIAHIQTIEMTESPSQQFNDLLKVTHFNNTSLANQISQFSEIILALYETNKAMEERWGKGLNEMMTAAIEPIPPLDNATVTLQGADNAKLAYPGPFGMPETSELIRINGSWMLNGDAEFGKAGSQQMLGMIQKAPQLISALNAIKDQVREGKFQTSQEAEMAIMQSIGTILGAG